MVEPTDPRSGVHTRQLRGARLDGTSPRRIFVEPEMRAVREVVPDVLAEKATEMPIIEHDDGVEQLTAEGADKALSHPVVPSLVRANPDGAPRARPPFDDALAQVVEDDHTRRGVMDRRKRSPVVRPS
jgi:hypothetical protein